MKGLIFTEFLDMVETRFSLRTADTMLLRSRIPSGGAYTSVGTYDHRELESMVAQLSAITHQPQDELVQAFGQYLFPRLAEHYPALVRPYRGTFALLADLDKVVHAQTLRMYPDLDLPRFDHGFPSALTMSMHYRSARGLAALAHGLIQGCADFFAERMSIERTDAPGSNGTDTCFLLTKLSAT